MGESEVRRKRDDDNYVEVFDTADWPRLDRSLDGRPAWIPQRWRGTRFDPGVHGGAALVVVGVLALVVVFFTVFRDRPVAQAVPPLPVVEKSAPSTDTVPTGEVSPLETGGPPAELVVSVVGLVHAPGLVKLPDGSRIADALTAAGGVREGGDTLALNLAQRLADGDQVVVGVDGGELPATAGPAGGLAGSGGRAGSGGGADAAAGSVVDLNTADQSALDSLPGVGPVTAAAILEWRTANGKFTSVDQLGEVDGIGPVRLEKLRDLVSV
ncbi:helix-hairpin-helix domain-containing protein [Rhodococcus sp. NPDC058521]|uniref:helix-hairpin-helix domain-containing protein n=1 Tax=Rhodococcus sp. NPDC058521 TaxID=3346536 RepID=UPI003668001F